jgi:hypothetical protein
VWPGIGLVIWVFVIVEEWVVGFSWLVEHVFCYLNDRLYDGL